MSLDNQISDLLYHYDCVIIPEFGGFVTNYKPAHLDKRLHLFHPPSKEVSFNKNLVRNDGLLANYLSDVKNCSFEEANAIIKEAVEDYFTRLNHGERVVFNKVGIIYRDADRNLRFQPGHEQNFLKDAYGLEQLFAVPVAQPEKQVSTQPVIPPVQSAPPVKSTPVIPIQRKAPDTQPQIATAAAQQEKTEITESASGHHRRWMWAAAVALPFVAYAGWLLTTTDLSRPQNLTIADLNPFGKSEPPTYLEREPISHADFDSNISDDLQPLLESEESVVRISFTDPPADPGVIVRLKDDVVTAAPVNTYVAPVEMRSMRYHVVGGCFGEERNAQRLVDSLREKGFQAYILDKHKGLYRVTYGNFARRSEALDALQKVKAEELKSAWLLVH